MLPFSLLLLMIPFPPLVATTNGPPSVQSPSVIRRTVQGSNVSPGKNPVKILVSGSYAQGDAQGNQGEKGKELDLEPGTPLVLTHRISLVPGSCSGACSVEYAALRERLVRLEREVSGLKEKCSGADGGCCPQQLSKASAETAECPDDCSDQGRCVNGTCVCFSGFTGLDCSSPTCPSDCKQRGQCVNGQCVCDSGFKGGDCSEAECPDDCNDRGRCINGQCVCESGFTGSDCSVKTCPNNCTSRGRCVNGQCVCESGFTGHDCSGKSCPNDCRNRGVCVNGKCVCDTGFTGPDCSVKTCPNNCRSRGTCINGQCVCESGFTGSDCSVKTCPNNCTNRGRCVNGQCVCESGFTGHDCSEKSCPNKCRNRGRCVNGQCVCDSGFTGLDCSEKACPNNCSNQGRCLKGKCVCNSGFTGPTCSDKACPNNCNNRGRCIDGQCACNDGFTGLNCSAKSCPSDCSENGKCVNGKCWCEPGFTGIDCSTKSCPGNCNNRGRCIKGKCVCRRGFTGPDCSQCHEGFTGEDCSLVMFGVTQLRTSDITDSSVTISWILPSIQYDTYHITFTSKKDGDQNITSKVEGSVSTFIQTGLAAGQQYQVSIRGEKNGRMGQEIATIFSTLISGPKNLQVVKTTTTAAVVQWEAPLGEVDRYRLSVSPNQTDGDKARGGKEMTFPPERDSAHIQGLEAGRLYDVSLVAQKGRSQSRPVIIQIIPGKTTMGTTKATVETVTTEMAQEDVEGIQTGKTKPDTAVFYKKIVKSEDEERKFDDADETIHNKTDVGSTRTHTNGKGIITYPRERLNASRPTNVTDSVLHNNTRMGAGGVKLLWRGKLQERKTQSVGSKPKLLKNQTVPLRMKPTLLKRPVQGVNRTYIRHDNLKDKPLPRQRLYGYSPEKEACDSSNDSQNTTDPSVEERIASNRSTGTGPQGKKCIKIIKPGLRRANANGTVLHKILRLLNNKTSTADNLNSETNIKMLSQPYTSDITQTGGNQNNVSVYIGDSLDKYQINGAQAGHSDKQGVTEQAKTYLSPDSTHSPQFLSQSSPIPHTIKVPTEVTETSREEKSKAIFPNQIVTPSIPLSNLSNPEVNTLLKTEHSELEDALLTSRPTPTNITRDSASAGRNIKLILISVPYAETNDGRKKEEPIDGDNDGTKKLNEDKLRIYHRSEPRNNKLRHSPVRQFHNRSSPFLKPPHHPSKGIFKRPLLIKKNGNQTLGGRITPSNEERPGKFNNGQTVVNAEKSPHSPPKEIKLVHEDIAQDYSNTSRELKPDSKGRFQEDFAKKGVSGNGALPQKGENVIQTKKTLSNASETSPGITYAGVKNVTARGFILDWEAPPGVFKKFIITRREYAGGKKLGIEKESNDMESEGKTSEGEGEENISEVDGKLSRDNTTVLPSESEKQDGIHKKVLDVSPGSLPKLHPPHNMTPSGTPKHSQVVPGTTRSLSFQDLHPQTQYSLVLFGVGPGVRSKIHRLDVKTGPDPPADLFFSNVTESSIYVSWTKPKSPVTGFKVTYTRMQEGDPVSLSVDSQNTTVSLKQLLPGSSYEVNVISTLGMDESDPIKELVFTVPDPPSDLRAINVTENKALLLWRPALATVDRYVIVYGSDKGSNVTITVSGNAAEYQLKGLKSSTVYTVIINSQLGNLQSRGVKTIFTTSSGAGEKGEGPQDLKASQVTPRSAVLTWKAPSTSVNSYKLTYETAGQQMKEVVLNASMTQHKLTRLRSSSKYTVRLEGERRGQYTLPSFTEFTTGALRFPFPTDCSQELLNGLQESEETEIFPNGKAGKAVEVYCDMETDGGGWTVIQRRKDGKTNFFRGWREYSAGFGNVNEEFWIGNDLLHNLTTFQPMSLRIDLRSGAESAFAHYSSFSIDSQKKQYRLYLSGYSGTAGDSMKYHNGRPFSTRDKDPQPFITRCAMSYKGGWWYKNCHEANLNGLYDTHTNHQGIIWTQWKGTEFSIPFAEMKIRPTSFRPPAQS